MIRICLLLALATVGAALAQDAPQSGRYVYVDRDTVFDSATGKIVRFESRRGGRVVEGGFVEIDPIKGTVTLRAAKVKDERISDFPDQKLPSYASPKHTLMTFMRALRHNDVDMARGCFGPKSLAQIQKRRGSLAKFMSFVRRNDDLYTDPLEDLVAGLLEDTRQVLHLHELQPGVWKFETQTSGLDRAVGLLRTITTAQSLYREGDKDRNEQFDYAPSLDALIATQLIAEGSGHQEGYRVEVWAGSEAPEFLWGAIAIPDTPSKTSPYLLTNQAGVIFASLEQPKLDKVKCQIDPNLKPFQLRRR